MSMYDIYTIADYTHPIFIALGLLFCWKVPTARWFLLSYAVVVVFSFIVFPTIIQWRTHYYLAQALMSISFLLPIFYRRDLALLLYNRTGLKFYKIVYEKQTLSAQECTIFLLIGLTIIMDLVTWLEVLAYKYSWIDNAYIKLYVRDNFIMVAQFFVGGCFLSYALKAESRERNFEKIEQAAKDYGD
ncbi:hypothetical protein [Pseudoalteromonas sp. OOF1S-7]|uniref:hypothetical protein n=1 Tax=Pseudoalteromonas sp. OOF1S-7 TaxID=2917757 RepID=UPI001EF5CDA4|nr:hypothetical protein [Pseudoalteromonas sp. OOF1S-7]MCG7537026.1 hypothetical protein [Pseudoalteromonas sp. OOF1S-7]